MSATLLFQHTCIKMCDKLACKIEYILNTVYESGSIYIRRDFHSSRSNWPLNLTTSERACIAYRQVDYLQRNVENQNWKNIVNRLLLQIERTSMRA